VGETGTLVVAESGKQEHTFRSLEWGTWKGFV
jgi:hypothetical protein